MIAPQERANCTNKLGFDLNDIYFEEVWGFLCILWCRLQVTLVNNKKNNLVLDKGKDFTQFCKGFFFFLIFFILVVAALQIVPNEGTEREMAGA